MHFTTCHIDYSSIQGEVRPLHGVNCGPIVCGGIVDLSARFRELAIPIVRTHDSNWPHAWEIDIPTIFPDLSADAESPLSYDFRRTDTYVNSILQTGAQIVYRLGVSIEHTPIKYFTAPPGDNEKWAAICRHIVMHYNDGWADGFHHGIRYWEIWNEPDIRDNMWAGTFAEYFLLYDVTARQLKAYDPTLQIGGPAAANPSVHEGILPAFLAYCRDEHLPLDFLSWHLYTDDPRDYGSTALDIRHALDAHGYPRAEIHCNEWHYMEAGQWGVIMDPAVDGQHKRKLFAKINGAEGAAFAVCTLLAFQHSPVAVANYYTGDTMWWGLFDQYGDREKTFYAFLAFRKLLETPLLARIDCADADDRLAIGAGLSADGQHATILLSNFNAPAHTMRLELTGFPWRGPTTCTVYRLDEDMNFDPTTERTIQTSDLCIEESLPPATVVMCRVENICLKRQ